MVQRARAGPAGLLLGEERLPFLAGAMHYFRVHRARWGRCLDAVVELGLPLLESYVPWAVHEREDGRFDFGDGPTVDGFERDLGGFLHACEERGLRVLLRPGPHINAELTGFGFPERILKDERCLALGSRGNRVVLPVPPRSFPVPSYASEQFQRQAATWLKAFGDFVLPFCWPDGPVVGVQVDNELALFFRTGAYDQDYHPDAVALYREYMRSRYPDGLPAGYGSGEAETLEPPRRFDAECREDLVRHLDWVAFKEWMVVRALDRMARVLRMVGMDQVVLFHNFPAQKWGTPCSLPAVEQKLDIAGLDVYLRGTEYEAAKRCALTLAGNSRLPLVLELGCGGWPWWFPLRWREQEQIALALLMHGIKGFNLYMTVERDRWYGAPVGPEGTHRSHFEDVRRLIAAVKGTETFTRDVPVAVMQVRDYERLSMCSSLVDPFPPAALDLLGVGTAEVCPEELPGLRRPLCLAYGHFLERVPEALDRLGLPYHYVDSELPASRLTPYQLLVVPGFEFIDRKLVKQLDLYVAGGGRLLLVGELPELDREMQPLDMPFPDHVLLGVEALGGREKAISEALEAIKNQLQVGTEAPEGVDLAVYEDQGRPAVLFAANRHGAPTTAAGFPGQKGKAWDALTGQPVDLKRIELRPFEVKMIRLSRSGE